MAHSTRKLGATFTWGGWIIGFVVLALLFDKILDNQHNPNQSVHSVRSANHEQIELQRNRFGHYLFDGRINGQRVSFLVDTGATTTSIPAHLGDRLGLDRGHPFKVQTANGVSTAYSTRLDQLELAGMRFNNVRASLNPGMKQDEILLGMNVLKNLELIQRDDTLIIRRPSG